MTPERYERLCKLFDEAQACAPAERAALGEAACALDPSFGAELRKLLAHDQRAEEERLLESPCVANAKAFFLADQSAAVDTPGQAATEDRLLGRRIGPYLVQQRVGTGGMGHVYRALRDDAYRQHVALKVVRPGLDGEQILRRFRTERQVLAELPHPHIARLLDGGTTDDGRPYLVMEYIDGEPLHRYCDSRQLDNRERVQLVCAVCETVQHAHEHGVVHRDLKPGNVLVTAYGTPKVTDFGLAKRVGGEPELSTPGQQTQTGAIVGTPSYMAPEQAGGKSAEVGPAVDVYALGAMLYELLTGRPPFRAETPLDTLMQVVSEEPVPPSRLHPKLARDLETICLKCLQKDPAKRYASAGALADDLRHFLAGEPIQARPIATVERVWRWCRRNQRVAALVATASFLLVLVAVVSTGAAFWIAAEHARAERQRAQAQANLEQALKAVDEMLTQVGETWLRDMPGVDEVRRELLKKALGFYQDFSRQDQLDPALRLETGRAQRRVAKIYDLLGQRDDAEQAYREALSIFDELHRGSPECPDYRLELAATSNTLGFQQASLSRWEQAEAVLQRALPILSGLVAEFPNRAHYRFELSRNHNSHGNLWRARGRKALARTAFEQAVTVNKQLVQDFPREPDYRRALAVSYNNVGVMQDNVADAQGFHDQAIAIQTELAEDFPQLPIYRQDLALTYLNQSRLRITREEWSQAEEAALKAAAIYTRLLEDFPRRPDLWGDLAKVHNNLGVAYKKSGQWDKAQTAYAAAIKIRAKFVDQYPNWPNAARSLADSHNNLGLLFVELEQWEKAQEAFEKALRLQNELVSKSPNRGDLRSDQARSHRQLAVVHKFAGHPEEAQKAARTAVDLMTKLHNDFPNEPDYERDLKEILRVLAPFLSQTGEPSVRK
jgi:tetratricopeptide (TPR) repeat protein